MRGEAPGLRSPSAPAATMRAGIGGPDAQGPRSATIAPTETPGLRGAIGRGRGAHGRKPITSLTTTRQPPGREDGPTVVGGRRIESRQARDQLRLMGRGDGGQIEVHTVLRLRLGLRDRNDVDAEGDRGGQPKSPPGPTYVVTPEVPVEANVRRAGGRGGLPGMGHDLAGLVAALAQMPKRAPLNETAVTPENPSAGTLRESRSNSARRCRRVGFTDAGWSSSVARWAHNPEVAGSNPVPATTPEGLGS